MAIDTDTPEGKMFQRLAQQLHDRRTGRVGGTKWSRDLLRNRVERPGLDLLNAYFRGDPPLRSDIHSGWKPYVRAFLRAGRFNIAELTVVSTSNRMDLRDFRTAAANDEQGDLQARRVMLANEWDQLSRQVHDFMLSMGDGYTITTPPTGGESFSRVTAEDPRQVITAHDAMTGSTIAGLKVYRDDWDAADHAYMAWRDGAKVFVQKLRHEGTTSITDGPFRFDSGGWDPVGDLQESPGGMMPFDRFSNRDGVGEFERHLDTIDRINDKVFNEWWISKIQAFRQRAVKNLPDTEKKVVDGKITEVEIDYTDMFTASPDEMWQVPGDVEFWESQSVDLTPITASVQKDLERYAAAVSQPLHTITPDAANGSAEGATLMREEHTFKIEDRIGRVDRRWCSVMAKCFTFMGDAERADVTRIESIWGPAERYSLAQRADAATKLKGILPTEAIWTDVLQYRPADVPNLRQLVGRDLVIGAVQPATNPAVPGAPAVPSAPAPRALPPGQTAIQPPAE